MIPVCNALITAITSQTGRTCRSNWQHFYDLVSGLMFILDIYWVVIMMYEYKKFIASNRASNIMSYFLSIERFGLSVQVTLYMYGMVH